MSLTKESEKKRKEAVVNLSVHQKPIPVFSHAQCDAVFLGEKNGNEYKKKEGWFDHRVNGKPDTVRVSIIIICTYVTAIEPHNILHVYVNIDRVSKEMIEKRGII